METSSSLRTFRCRRYVCRNRVSTRGTQRTFCASECELRSQAMSFVRQGKTLTSGLLIMFIKTLAGFGEFHICNQIWIWKEKKNHLRLLAGDFCQLWSALQQLYWIKTQAHYASLSEIQIILFFFTLVSKLFLDFGFHWGNRFINVMSCTLNKLCRQFNGSTEVQNMLTAQVVWSLRVTWLIWERRRLTLVTPRVFWSAIFFKSPPKQKAEARSTDRKSVV